MFCGSNLMYGLSYLLYLQLFVGGLMSYLRNKLWKPECVGSFNMGWGILVFYPEPEASDTIY